MYSSLLLRDRIIKTSTSSKLLYNLSSTRSMGGGPRTYPGGISKALWLGMIAKKAREKEKTLIRQENLIYESRFRAHVRDFLVAQSELLNLSTMPLDYSPVFDRIQLKALVDRFKIDKGAEDLWNEHDGPFEPPPLQPSQPKSLGSNGTVRSQIDFRCLIMDRRDLTAARETGHSLLNVGCSLWPRNYSARPRGRRKIRIHESSSSDTEVEEEEEEFVESSSVDKAKVVERPRSRKDSLEKKLRLLRSNSNVKKLLCRDSPSRDSSEKYGYVKTKNLSANEFEKECSFLWGPDHIREELRKKKLAKDAVKVTEEDPPLSKKRFVEFNISPLTFKALAAAGYTRMTMAQEATLSVSLEGKDALVKASTDSGKSTSFLVPAIEAVLKASGLKSPQKAQPTHVLILCPTPERASQIAAEANLLLKYHVGIGVQTLVGGTPLKLDQKCLETDPCQILVANPGRLLDHLENKSGFSMRNRGLKMLVVDETDHFVDLGFRKDVLDIVEVLPPQRQSLLFAAKISKEIRRMSQLVLKKDRAYINSEGLRCEESQDKL